MSRKLPTRQRCSARRARRAITLGELVVAMMILLIGLSGLYSLLVASDHASGRVVERSLAARVARDRATELAASGYDGVWSLVKDAAEHAPTLVSQETRVIGHLNTEGQTIARANFVVSTFAERLPDSAVLIRTLAWRESSASAAGAEKPAGALPPGDVLFEKAERVLFAPHGPVSLAALDGTSSGGAQ